VIINAENLTNLYTGFNTKFNEGFQGATSYVGDIAMEVPSTSRAENYAWLGQFPGLREWIGQRVVKSLTTQSYTLVNKDYEVTISVPRNDIEDDSYGVFGPMFTELGRNSKTHPDELLFALMISSFTTPCYDGKTFFAADHPVGDPANGAPVATANTDGGSGAPWFLLDTSRAIKPYIYQKRRDYALTRKDDPRDDRAFYNREFVYGIDARCNVGVGLWQLAWGSKQTLDADHYKAARSAMMGFKGDEGKLLGVTPTTLVCGASNEGAGLKLLNTELGTGGESNEWKGTAKLIVTPYLP
jgi:phage major head subunit gpT-like protein